ncbi:MAG: hypothetical protein HZB39_02130 [Planctomycetes bacterium]|nr:hypothetical protein [Planctomycetota bacterium]
MESLRSLTAAIAASLSLGTGVVAQSTPCFESNFGTNLGLGDDAVAQNLVLGFNFPFAGGTSSAIDVASNGSIWVQPSPNNHSRCCFGDPTALVSEGPSINPFWMDLDPSSGGAVWFNTFPGRAVITWDNVPEYGGVIGMTFQVQLLADGSITFWWDAACTSGFGTALVGVSPGGNVLDPGATDLSTNPLNTGVEPTLYEVYDQFFGPPFDLAATSLHLVPSGTGWLLLPRTGCVPASATRYGNGCPRPPIAYEFFQPTGVDLSNTTYLFTPNGSGYSVTTCAVNCWEPNFATNLFLSDDSTSGPLNLGFAFPYPSGSSSSIDVSSNGFVWIDSATSMGSRCCDGDVNWFLSDPPSICALWMDLNPSAGGAVYYDTFPGRAVVTWDQIPEFAGANTCTMQLQLFADGRMLLSYGTVSSTLHFALAGFSGVSGGTDPGSTDFTTSVPFSISNTGVPLALDSSPGSRPVLGTTFSMDVTNIPASTLLGVVGLGVFQLNTDLTVIGMPGCALLQSTDTTLPLPPTPPSSTASLPLPNVTAFTGILLYGQAITVSPGSNPLGLVTSNGLRIKLGQ